VTGFGEADPSRSKSGVDPVSPPVDDHVVVEPTEGDQTVSVDRSALGPWDLVVGFESVSAGATIASHRLAPIR
jgi:hypothetical protein